MNEDTVAGALFHFDGKLISLSLLLYFLAVLLLLFHARAFEHRRAFVVVFFSLYLTVCVLSLFGLLWDIIVMEVGVILSNVDVSDLLS